MWLRMIVVSLAVFSVLIVVIGCDNSPELITCSDDLKGLVTARVGRTEYGSFYKLGTVAVRYEKDKSHTNSVLSVPVNNFFTKRGYAPKVLDVLFSDYQVIHFGEDVDTAPMLRDLNRVAGVKDADLYPLFRMSDLILFRLYTGVEIEDGEEDIMPKALIEVGKADDGSLYELGSVLIQYHNSIIPPFDPSVSPNFSSPKEDVHDFLIDKGYESKGDILHVRLEIIYIGECVDAMPILEDLRSLSVVADAHLNTFSLFATPVTEMLLVNLDISEAIE